jgi:hypothetical protein
MMEQHFCRRIIILYKKFAKIYFQTFVYYVILYIIVYLRAN